MSKFDFVRLVSVKSSNENELTVGIPAKKIKDVREITCPYGIIDRPYK